MWSLNTDFWLQVLGAVAGRRVSPYRQDKPRGVGLRAMRKIFGTKDFDMDADGWIPFNSYEMWSLNLEECKFAHQRVLQWLMHLQDGRVWWEFASLCTLDIKRTKHQSWNRTKNDNFQALLSSAFETVKGNFSTAEGEHSHSIWLLSLQRWTVITERLSLKTVFERSKSFVQL